MITTLLAPKFIVLYVFLERLLTRGDYKRPGHEHVEPRSSENVRPRA